MEDPNFGSNAGTNVWIRLLCGLPESGSAEIPFAHVNLASRSGRKNGVGHAAQYKWRGDKNKSSSDIHRRRRINRKMQNEGLC
jgi:hypothetical protein